MPRYSLDDVRRSAHGIDSWWTRLFIDPVAIRLTYLAANFTNISPNTITFITFPIIFVSAYFFYLGEPIYLIIGAIIYEFNFALDCVDGKLARLKGQTSTFGAFSDLFFDNINVFVNLFALTFGQYQKTGEDKFLIIGMIYIFVHMIQIINKYIALQIINQDLKKDFYSVESLKDKSGIINRIRHFFAKRGLNLVLFTTVEGEAVVFFFGPITGYVFLAILLSLIFVSLFFILKTIFFFKSALDEDRRMKEGGK